MENNQVVCTRLDDDLVEQIKKSENFTTLSDFAKRAIKNELNNEKQSSKEFANMAKRVEALNTKTTEQKVSDLEIKLQIIYEEIQRQNEVLALIHRRSTFAANFSLHSMDVLLKSNDLGDEEKATLIDLTTNEIKNIGLQLSRK